MPGDCHRLRPDGTDIRRDHRGGALRRFADWRCCWPARATAFSWSTARRSRATPCPPTWCSRSPSPRSRAGDCSIASSATGCPPIHTYTFDFGPVHDLGSAGHEGRSGGVLSAADRPGQAAGRCRGRGRRGDPRGLHRRGGPDRRRTRRRHQGPFEGRRRRSPSVPRSSSARTAGTRSWPRPSGPSSTTRSRRCSPPTTPTGAVSRWTGGSKPTSARTADSRRRPRTTA